MQLKTPTNLFIMNEWWIISKTCRIKIFLEYLHKILKLLHEGCIQSHSMQGWGSKKSPALSQHDSWKCSCWYADDRISNITEAYFAIAQHTKKWCLAKSFYKIPKIERQVDLKSEMESKAMAWVKWRIIKNVIQGPLWTFGRKSWDLV